MSKKIPDLTHELGNHLNGVCAIAGCLIDRLKDESELPNPLKEELTRALKLIETKAQEASSDIDEIKEELRLRGQYT